MNEQKSLASSGCMLQDTATVLLSPKRFEDQDPAFFICIFLLVDAQ